MKPYYEYRHVVGFEDTNLVGNVYYANHVRWQGKCREMFLRDEAPSVLDELRDGLKIFTIKAECEYIAELSAFDTVSIRMRLEELTQTQIGFAFDYVRDNAGLETLAARGRQRVACMRASDGNPVPVRVPDALREAVARYDGRGASGKILA